MNIFLSHNYKDKPVVEQIAIRLRNIYGEDSVFYDSWSIKPGEGIIDKMDEGLVKADYFFFRWHILKITVFKIHHPVLKFPMIATTRSRDRCDMDIVDIILMFCISRGRDSTNINCIPAISRAC